MPEAQEGEVTILEVETLGFGKTKVNFVLYYQYFKCVLMKLVSSR